MTEPISIATSPNAHTEPPRGERTRIKGLDVLRGIAASAVVLYHYTYNYQRLFHGHKSHSWIEYGALGVQLFFIISGFVIFMTLEKTRRPVDFVRSRFSRLFPAYWAAVILTFLVLKLFPLPAIAGADFHKYHPTLLRGILNLTMCQEMIGVGHVDPVYWTLQLELCFYLIMFVLFCTKQIKHVELYLLGILAVSESLNIFLPGSSSLLRNHLAINLIVSDLRLLTVSSISPSPHCHIHVFLIGIMLYKLSKAFNPFHLIVLAVCLAYSFVREPGMDFYLTVAFTALVFAGARGWLGFLENRVLIFLGFVSYSLYLTHQNIGYELIHAMEHHGVAPNIAIIAAAAVAVVLASALTYGIEQPALRLLRGKKPKIENRAMPDASATRFAGKASLSA